jgi:class 3 adenylate cyclase/tetratricopeptide (TPR) repeat protein
VSTCPSCGHENPDSAKFCMECATPLRARGRPVAEERRVVTIVFCDLASFTARSEALDPEDVRAFLLPYYEVVSQEIARHGGTIDKFLGDGVMAVFGVPTAHEDDPERAVRMALRVLERLPDLGLDLHARIGVNTGEVIVAVEAMERGDAITGDAANTAARLQAVAPIDGVVVGERTWRATGSIFDYAELQPATLKGKAEPVRVFHAKSPSARLGFDITRTYETPFIGREIDLALLKGVFDRALAANAVEIVTIVGEPGLGKSRIVAELLAYVDGRPELVTWRQGRCLPYGEGVSFWALGEIVKAHAGVLESDPASIASAKLDAVLTEGEERGWFRQRLLPLLGIEATSSSERPELFTAWRRFIEDIATANPTVLVFEDLHWADDAMLAFLEHLADWAEGVPLVVIGTTRPELFDRHPNSTRALQSANTIQLSRLSTGEMKRLVASLLQADVIPAELRGRILDRAGGNPLYAEEFVRLLHDKDLIIEEGRTSTLREGAEIPLPDSVQALIAARLDTLSPTAKSMLADAAVVGKVFWAGAVAATGDRDPDDVRIVLRELHRRRFVRSARRSSIEGEAEFTFWHSLVRDVAYGQLPRAVRASRHLSAAAWIESKAAARIEDVADVLAHHYATAMELARAAGQSANADALKVPALRFLMLAGERKLGLDTPAALEDFERALALTPAGHPARADVLAALGQAAKQAARFAEAAKVLEEATSLFRERGNLPAAARAMIVHSRVLASLADPRGWTLPADALSLLEPLGPSAELVEAITEVAGVEVAQGRSESGVSSANRALALAETLGLQRPARALGFRGGGRSALGDAGGLQDTREAIGLATAAGQADEAALQLNNLAARLWMFDGPKASAEILNSGIAFAEQRGLTDGINVMMAGRLDLLVDAGEFDEALRVAGPLVELFETEHAVEDLIVVRSAQARIFAMRGEATKAADSLDLLESTSPGNEDYLVLGLGASALARAALGQDDRVSALLQELARDRTAREAGYYIALLPAMVRTAQRLGDTDLAKRLADGVDPVYPYARHALTTAGGVLTEGRGDLSEAVEAYAEGGRQWERFEVIPELAFALLGQGRCLLKLGLPTECVPVLQRAREIFAGLQAAPALAETDTLVHEATVRSS